jgi:hypothetical protein
MANALHPGAIRTKMVNDSMDLFVRCKLPFLFGVKLVKVICCISLHNHKYGHNFSKFCSSQIKDKTLIELTFFGKEQKLHLQHLGQFKKLVAISRTNLEKCPIIKY